MSEMCRFICNLTPNLRSMDLFTNWQYQKEQIIQLKQTWISVKLNAMRQVKIYLYMTDMQCIIIQFLLNKKYLMKTKF